jgi:5-methyltetrahydrofolate--homocysteine methyltransferase
VNYIGAAVETIEGIRLVKEHVPFVKTVLGISNISFGLPAAAREVVNSVFLYYCTKAGLDLAIVNAEKLERFASIPVEERRLAENLLFNTPRWRPPTNRCAPRPRIGASRPPNRRPPSTSGTSRPSPTTSAVDVKRTKAPADLAARSAPGQLHHRRHQGRPDSRSRPQARRRRRPLDIINGPLMAGMSEVGRLFNNNELIVAEVLQSAEAMKAAVNHLEQFMEKSETAARGKIVLATVKGDVHDIGKNLVEIILSNNGYTVVNLGIKVPPEALIQAHASTSPTPSASPACW